MQIYAICMQNIDKEKKMKSFELALLSQCMTIFIPSLAFLNFKGSM